MQQRKEKKQVQVSDEVDKYLSDPFENSMIKKFNILWWWKGNQERYPILSKIAKDIFAIPRSTVASENAFNLGRRIVDPFRASLTPRMVDALICNSDWLRADEFSINKEPTDDEFALYKELEELGASKLICFRNFNFHMLRNLYLIILLISVLLLCRFSYRFF